MTEGLLTGTDLGHVGTLDAFCRARGIDYAMMFVSHPGEDKAFGTHYSVELTEGIGTGAIGVGKSDDLSRAIGIAVAAASDLPVSEETNPDAKMYFRLWRASNECGIDEAFKVAIAMLSPSRLESLTELLEAGTQYDQESNAT